MIESTPLVTDGAVSKTGLDIHEILKILPHRYPFLLIDRVLELKRKERIVAIKNVTINEPFFNGHFPGLPIMPGVLIVEAIAQAGGALLLTEVEDRSDKVMVFTGNRSGQVSPPGESRRPVADRGGSAGLARHAAHDRREDARRRICGGQASGGSDGVVPADRQLARARGRRGWRRRRPTE